jgi:hypothetical protein
MNVERRIEARLVDAHPLIGAERQGVLLVFEPISARTAAVLGVPQIDDFADLGPELTIPAVSGIGKVLRTLRAGRIAAPEPHLLLGRARHTASLLARARSAPVALRVRPRVATRFVAWTETGVHRVEDVADVFEYPDAWIVTPRRGHPVRIERAGVARQLTESQPWWEVVAIERSTRRNLSQEP